MSATATTPRRRTWWSRLIRLQFSLRTMLLLMLLSGPITFGWLAYIRPYQRDRAIEAYVTKLNGNCGTETQGPSWLISLMGAERFQRLVSIQLKGPKISDEDIHFVCEASQLRTLTLSKMQGISDECMVSIGKLRELTTLSISSRQLTGWGLAELTPLKKLRVLKIYYMQLKGEGLAPLATFKNLEELTLYCRSVKLKDPGLRHLANNPKLKLLIMRNLTLRGRGVKRFQSDRREDGR